MCSQIVPARSDWHVLLQPFVGLCWCSRVCLLLTAWLWTVGKRGHLLIKPGIWVICLTNGVNGWATHTISCVLLYVHKQVNIETWLWTLRTLEIDCKIELTLVWKPDFKFFQVPCLHQVISYYVADVLTLPGVPGLFIAAIIAAAFRFVIPDCSSG